MPMAEYRQGLDFGAGVDSLSGEIKGDAVLRTEAQESTGAKGQEVLLTLRQIESREDLEHELGISAEVSASYCFFSAEGKFSLAEKSQFQQYSLFLVVHVTVLNSFRQMRDVQLKDEATALLRDGHTDRFREQCGDLFVRGKQTGGELAAVLEIETSSASDSQEVKSHFEASGWGVSGSADYGESFKNASSNHRVNFTLYQKGGIQEASLDPAKIIEKALRFAEEVKDDQSVDFSVLLADYRTLDMPFGPNWVDLQNAKELLQTLISYRRDALDRLNAVRYVLLHPEQFKQPLPTGLNDVADKLAEYITAVKNAASRCVNNVTQCQIPKGLELPMVLLPERIVGIPASSLAGLSEADRNWILSLSEADRNWILSLSLDKRGYFLSLPNDEREYILINPISIPPNTVAGLFLPRESWLSA